MKRLIIFLPLIIAQLSGITFSSKAQNKNTYTPRETYSALSTELIKGLQDQLRVETKNLDSRRHARILKNNTNNLIELVKREAFIKDDSLNNYIRMVLQKLLDKNQLKRPPKHFLISKDHQVNAYLTVAGTLVVNIGLLSRISNESDLAFVLAHEIAHSELDHLYQKIEKYTTSLGMAKKETKKFKKGTISGEGIDLLQNLAYDNGRFSKQMEIEADSLGFILFRNAGYCGEDAIATLSLLDSAYFPKYPLGYRLLEPFHADDYPIQAHWLKKRPSGFNKMPPMTLIYRTDSLGTHPEIEERKERLNASVKTHDCKSNNENTEYLNKIIKSAAFESVESAFYTRKYDECIYLALQLKKFYPRNDYLVAKIAEVFINLYKASSWGRFSYFVQPYTGYYHPELRQLNNFLYNLDAYELAEIAFHFLANEENFNESNQSHYYLLWKIAGITARRDVQKKIKSAYRSFFPEGKYYEKLR